METAEEKHIRIMNLIISTSLDALTVEMLEWEVFTDLEVSNIQIAKFFSANPMEALKYLADTVYKLIGIIGTIAPVNTMLELEESRKQYHDIVRLNQLLNK